MPNQTANPPIFDNASLIAAGTAIAAATVIAGTLVYKKITGNAYSSQEKNRLNELKRLYQEIFQRDAPVQWLLDENDKPTYQVRNQKWSQPKKLMGHYHYQSYLIAEYAGTYLLERHERVLGKGSPGDLVEQFMADWIDFSVNELIHLGCDAESIKKITQRIHYIEAVQKHEFIFQFGFITRNKNKLDTIESIKQQLEACLTIAARESLRQCAREQFDHCRADISVLLLACVYTLYYARNTEVYFEPLELTRLSMPAAKFLTRHARQIYPKIIATHTGAMLKDIILIAGLETFGATSLKAPAQYQSVYFNSDLTCKAVNWQMLQHDLPPWVPKDQVKTHLMEFQRVGESALRVANLKHLIEEAYDLTGQVGDVWAYSDIYGKLSLQALVFLLEKEIELLKKRFDGLYQYHNTARHTYNLTYRVNPKEGLNLNFNKVDEQKNHIDIFYQRIKHAAQAIQEQMKKIPPELTEQVNQKQKAFYRSLLNYVKQFYPESYVQYQLLDKVEAKNNSSHSQIKKIPELVWPFKSHPNTTHMIILDKDTFQVFNDQNHDQRWWVNQWQIGDSYTSWIMSFFKINKRYFSQFQQLASQLQSHLLASPSRAQLDYLVTNVEKQVEFIYRKIMNEKPAWRFQWGIWPIKTAGWPFHRRATQFANLVLRELNLTRQKILMAKTIAYDYLNQTLSRGQTERQNAIALQWTHSVKKALTAWRNNKAVFKMFNKIDEIKKIVDEVCVYRDNLLSHALTDFDQTLSKLHYDLIIEIEYSSEIEEHANYEQMQLVTQVLQICRTDFASRTAEVQSLMAAAEIHFSKQQIHALTKNYDHYGLLKKTEVDNNLPFYAAPVNIPLLER